MEKMNPSSYNFINIIISNDIKEQLRLQGHFFSGDLERSITPEKILEFGNIVLTARALDYIKELEYGVPASRINPNSEDIGKIAKWVLERNLVTNPAQATTAARLIIQKWQKQGKPLETSKEYSKTGQILHAISITLREQEQKYYRLIDDETISILDKEFNHVKSGKI